MRFLNTLLATSLLAFALVAAQDEGSSSSSTSGTITPSASASASGSASASRNNSSSSVSSTSSTTSLNITTFTTSLTVFPTTTTSGIKADPTTVALTFTLNSTAYDAVNSSIWNGNYTNGTVPYNGDKATKPWEEGDDWLPFHIRIDPAFGVLGALLIISGIPVAILGGKNRWSSLAISTGYALMLLTLILILRFGVQPNLQPPSPEPPSKTLRGLYLLGCVIASFFGAAAGIFLYTFAKYWVSAIGGFTFGWFLLATKQGGLVSSVLGRWGLLGGLTVAGLVGSLPKFSNEYMMLVSTAWIGATAFTLGIDCYTRGGLKEFYMYNLGFHELFPKLTGFKYPLTQTMMIELGILAAMVVIGAAIQFRVLNILTKKLRQMRDEEEAKIEAEEIEKAAERFKNVGHELNEWEEKHGNGNISPQSGGQSSERTDPYGSLAGSAKRVDHSHVHLPQLGFTGEGHATRGSSPHSLIDRSDSRGLYESVALQSPSLPHPETASGGLLGLEELKSHEPPSPTGANPELESQMRLLEEVKRAREEIRGSIDRLRGSTPASSIKSDTLLLGRATTTTPTPTIGSMSDHHTRNLSDASSHILDLDFSAKRNRHLSSNSSKILDLDFTENQERERQKAKAPSPPPAPVSEWDAYLAERRVMNPPPGMGATPPLGHRASQNLITVPASVAKGIVDRRERTNSMFEPRVSDFGPRDSRMTGTYPMSPPGSGSGSGSEQLVSPNRALRSPNDVHHGRGHESRSRPTSYQAQPGGSRPHSRPTSYQMPPGTGQSQSQNQSRPVSQQLSRPAMSIDELAERHRQRMSRMQDPVTSKIKEEVEVDEARKRWERQQRAEKEEMRRKEKEKERYDRGRKGDNTLGPVAGGGNGVKGKEKVLKSTDEWRRSIVLDAAPIGHNRDKGKEREKERKRASRQFAS